MTLFDLLFIAAFLAAAVVLLLAAVAALRKQTNRVLALLRWLGIGAGVYLGVLVTVSLLSPRCVLEIGDEQCSDDWCIAVVKVNRQEGDEGPLYGLTFRITSRARRRAQRERGVQVCLIDELGRCYDPVPDTAEVPFDTLLQPSGEHRDDAPVPGAGELP
jgi:hypothetical protein